MTPSAMALTRMKSVLAGRSPKVNVVDVCAVKLLMLVLPEWVPTSTR